LIRALARKADVDWDLAGLDTTPVAVHKQSLIPAEKITYLQDIANAVRGHRKFTLEQSAIARKLFQLHGAKETLIASGAVAEVIEMLEQ
ncbi:hypothetical protein MXD63_44850, partial [Frankia sp. Cpl3]|nr:hypothetical protein [Frankia sp. Cpl3]